jgi:glycerophosphoryl diester phosphodiesterase
MTSAWPFVRLLAAATLLSAGRLPEAASWNTLSGERPMVIGHRGASGYRPEHTLAAYQLAIEQGADFIEPDLVLTKDGELLARHEPLLARVDLNPDGSIQRVNGRFVLNRTETSTNVWQLPRYASRLTVKTLDGEKVGGWFAEDFTAAEIRADIRAEERLRDLRMANNAYNGQFVIPTLQEVIDLAKERTLATGRTIGVYPETKHPTYFKNFTDANRLTRLEDKLVQVLHANYGDDAKAPVFIQSFEVSNLKHLNGRTNIRLTQLLSTSGRPYDFTVAGDIRTYADLATAIGLDSIRHYANAVSVEKSLLIPVAGGSLGTPAHLVAEAHRLGLAVHAWTFRAENAFLPHPFVSSTNPAGFGNLQGELNAYLALGIDGFFTDQPNLGVAALGPMPGQRKHLRRSESLHDGRNRMRPGNPSVRRRAQRAG